MSRWGVALGLGLVGSVLAAVACSDDDTSPARDASSESASSGGTSSGGSGGSGGAPTDGASGADASQDGLVQPDAIVDTGLDVTDAADAADAFDAAAEASDAPPSSDAADAAFDADATDVEASADAPFCAPGDFACVGDALVQCNASGSAFDPVATCKPSLCDAAGGACLECATPADCPSPPECVVAVCQGNTCSTAPASGGTACGGGFCNGAGACGQCLPGSVQCAGNVPQTCSAAYTWQSGAACSGSTPQCQGGQCKPAPGPSCNGLAPTCAGGIASCCAIERVPGGAFKRSYDGVTYTDPSFDASVSDFWLDAYEVTVGRFRRFVDNGTSTQASPPPAGSGAHPNVGGSGWSASWNSSLAANAAALRAALACDPALATWTDAPGPNENRPIACVTWYEAFAFCAWDGGRLATEAEWNRAAAGGDQQRVYPWSAPPSSTTVTSAHASYLVGGVDQCMGDGVVGCTIADLIPVGTKPAGNGRWGHAELAGNVWEWALDAFVNPYPQIPCSDCATLSGSSQRVLRGGSFFAYATSILSSKRHYALPAGRYHTAGFRCAKSG